MSESDLPLDFVQQFHQLIARLRAHPRIELHACQVAFGNRPVERLARSAAFMQEEYGFTLPRAGWQWFLFYSFLDLYWRSPPDPSGPPVLHTSLGGAINLSPAETSISDQRYRLHLGVDEPGAEHASYFDNYAHQDVLLPTMLLYDRDQRQYLGLRVFLRPELVKLELDLTTYVTAALAWHGAYAWQLLYCSLDDFRSLSRDLRQRVYRLRHALPLLFPDADWSIIATKQAYFDLEEVDRATYRR